MTLISQDDHRIVGAWAACEEHNHYQTTKRNNTKDGFRYFSSKNNKNNALSPVT